MRTVAAATGGRRAQAGISWIHGNAFVLPYHFLCSFVSFN
jgi:hypothetical protein